MQLNLKKERKKERKYDGAKPKKIHFFQFLVLFDRFNACNKVSSLYSSRTGNRGDC